MDLLQELGTSFEPTIGSKGKGLFGIPGAHLPGAIEHLYNDLVQGGKKPGARTYALAIGIMKNWAAGHNGSGGKVNADVQAKAVAAMAEWERLKAKAHARTASKEAGKMKEAESCGMPHAKLWKDGRKKCPACGADLGAAVKEMAAEAVLALARRGALSEAGANQPRFKRSGKYTDPTRGVRAKKRSHADVMAELQAAGHAGNGGNAPAGKAQGDWAGQWTVPTQ